MPSLLKTLVPPKSLLTVCTVVVFINLSGPYFWLPITAVLPLLVHFFRVYKNDNPKLLDPELKTLALSAFAFSALSFLTFYMS